MTKNKKFMLVTSVFNAKRQLVEEPKELLQPVLFDESSPHARLFWGSMVHLATPIENTEEGSYILIELKAAEVTSSSSNAVSAVATSPEGPSNPADFNINIGWTAIPIARETIDSKNVTIRFLPYPVDHANVNSVSTNNPISYGANSKSKGYASYITLQLLLSRKNRKLDTKLLFG